MKSPFRVFPLRVGITVFFMITILTILPGYGQTTSFSPTTNNLNRAAAGPITSPIITEIAYKTYAIDEFGMDEQYLLVGSKRALLIDTGSGFYNIKAVIRKLTDLPYDVAITHGHPDHAGGMREFKAVWLGPADWRMASGDTQKIAKTYGEIMWGMPFGYKHIWGYTPADTRWGDFDQPLPTLKPLYDGKIFDLGSRIVTAYHTPGHTAGSYVFLDPKTRILFTGDAANPNLLTSLPVVTVLRSLLKIKNLKPKYDRIYNGHISYAGTMDALAQNPHVLGDLIIICRGLLNGTVKGKTVPNFLDPSKKSTKATYKVADIVFKPGNLWISGEPHIIP